MAYRLYPTEINALEMRTKGSSLAMATNWIMNYMVVQVTPPGIANLGWKFWIIWACICFSFIPVTYLFYPETANRRWRISIGSLRRSRVLLLRGIRMRLPLSFYGSVEC